MDLFKNRDRLLDHLQNYEIAENIECPIPLHFQSATSTEMFTQHFLVTEYQTSHLLMLPARQFVELEQIKFMFDSFRLFSNRQDDI